MSHALQVFTSDQVLELQRRLAYKVVKMMGRKLEEDDWTSIYCEVLGYPPRGWSNLEIDVVAGRLGVEHKMLQVRQGEITSVCGTSLMHPALTRSIRIESTDEPADDVMTSVLTQYGALLGDRRARIAVDAKCSSSEVELRTGWLLWQENLRQFLYFEELAVAPDPAGFTAEWVTRPSGGPRKGSKNLWVYDRATGKKRYSVTTSAGIKIQPYFDVPSSLDPNAYVFTVYGEPLADDLVNVWLATTTHTELLHAVAMFGSDDVSGFIVDAAATLQGDPPTDAAPAPVEQAIHTPVSTVAYEALRTAFPGVNDDHSVQLLLSWSAQRQ